MQQSLVAQVNIMAEAVKDTVKTNADMVWHLALHYRRLDSTTHTLERFTARSPSLEDDNPIQRMKLFGSRARTCTGHTLGASFVGQPVRHHCEDLDSSLADGNSKATHGVVDFMAVVDIEALVAADTGVLAFWVALVVVEHIKEWIRQPTTRSKCNSLGSCQATIDLEGQMPRLFQVIQCTPFSVV
jgi:hypothetical protein